MNLSSRLGARITAMPEPVSGGPQGAKSGRLAIWVGGDETIFGAHKQVLDAFTGNADELRMGRQHAARHSTGDHRDG
jgi:3-hydroxyisobutyrate dehydrogenase-like beta-hydroxyacid dehydrogenase